MEGLLPYRHPSHLVVKASGHPIFRNFDPRAYSAGSLAISGLEHDITEGARVLACWSVGEVPEIVESACGRILSFGHFDELPWNDQMKQLLRNAAEYVSS